MQENELLNKIKTIFEMLDDLDDYFEELPEMNSRLDTLWCDYRHMIRENNFDKEVAYKIATKIKDSEVTRKKVKQDWDLARIFKNNEQKIIGKENRQFLLAELYKKMKVWGQPYKYRILTDEEVDYLLKEEKKKRGRPKKEESSNELIQED